MGSTKVGSLGDGERRARLQNNKIRRVLVAIGHAKFGITLCYPVPGKEVTLIASRLASETRDGYNKNAIGLRSLTIRNMYRASSSLLIFSQRQWVPTL